MVTSIPFHSKRLLTLFCIFHIAIGEQTNNWHSGLRKTTRNCWPWKVPQNPRMAVVVRWFIEQDLYPLLTSLNSAAALSNETISVWIVDTNPVPPNTNKRGNLSYIELTRQIFACSALVPWLHVHGLMAPLLPSDLQDLWGYGETDWVLQQLHDVENWDHIMFTNGDNTYSRYLLERTLDARRFGYALIGFDFVSHYKRKGRHNQAVQNTLQINHSDLGSLIFHRGAVGRKGENCSCGLTFYEASRVFREPHSWRGWRVADAGLIKLTQQCSKNSQIVINEVLFHHQ